MRDEVPDHSAQGFNFKQKGIVSVTGFDFAESHLFAVFQKSVGQSLRLGSREQPVAGKRHDQSRRLNAVDGFDEISAGRGGQVKIVR